MCTDVTAHEQDDLFSKPEFDLTFAGSQPGASVSSGRADAADPVERPGNPVEAPSGQAEAPPLVPSQALPDHLQPLRPSNRPQQRKRGPRKHGRPGASPARKPDGAAHLQTPSVHLTVQDVARHFSVSVATIWRWTAENPAFPKGHKLSPGTTRWFREDLMRFDAELRGETP